jgi:hypothetical protein
MKDFFTFAFIQAKGSPEIVCSGVGFAHLRNGGGQGAIQGSRLRVDDGDDGQRLAMLMGASNAFSSFQRIDSV